MIFILVQFAVKKLKYLKKKKKWYHICEDSNFKAQRKFSWS